VVAAVAEEAVEAMVAFGGVSVASGGVDGCGDT